MVDKVLLECGCVATAINTKTGQPSCPVHVGLHPGAETPVKVLPDLTGRQSRCSDKCKIVPSSFSLPFFEYRGKGSRSAIEQCKECAYLEIVHTRLDNPITTHEFAPHGSWEFDRHYDGCMGWD